MRTACPPLISTIVRLKRELETVRRTRELHRAKRRKVPFPVLADLDRTVYRAYGLGKALGIQQSGTFLIDAAGTVRYANRATVPLGALKEPALLAAIAQSHTSFAGAS